MKSVGEAMAIGRRFRESLQEAVPTNSSTLKALVLAPATGPPPPTIQKPEKLMERLVKASSNPADLVFDPFCGSGTVPVVCRRLQRRFVACEINPEYCRIADERLANAERDGGSGDALFSLRVPPVGREAEPAQVGLL